MNLSWRWTFRTLWKGLVAADCLIGLAGCRPEEPRQSEPALNVVVLNEPSVAASGEAPTFADDIAPLIYAKCVACHRPQGAAPFAFLTYEQVAQRARQIVEVTQSGYMPPWPPERGAETFADARDLTKSEIALLQAWVEAGHPRGDPTAAPAPPEFPAGWQLGVPDLELRMEVPYQLRAEGPDEFRNFVLPVPLEKTRYVKAIELRPNNPVVVHHAVIGVDKTSQSRAREAEDKLPGFSGMVDGRLSLGESATAPGGQWIGWTPGSQPRFSPPGIAWPLEPGADLILQLHLQTTGKPESISVSLGVHFTDEPPRREPYALLLSNRDIDIPAGEESYVLTDVYTLPVDVEVLEVYPHAHFICKDVSAEATLPDGSVTSLIRIRDWDFNWQDSYRYREPLQLPAGTRVSMRYIYDNSEDNPRNPHSPPQRITYGEQSADEMGDLIVNLVTKRPAEINDLRADYFRSRMRVKLEQFEKELAANPGNAKLTADVGDCLLNLGQLDRAKASYEAAIDLEPEKPLWKGKLSDVLAAQGQHDEAVEALQDAARLSSDNAEALRTIARAFVRLDNLQAAQTVAMRAAKLAPREAESWKLLASVLAESGAQQAAQDALLRAIAIEPQDSEAHAQLAERYAALGDSDSAIRHYQEALRHDRHALATRMNFANLLLQNRQWDDAATHYLKVLDVRPKFTDALARVGVIRAIQKRHSEAETYLLRALQQDANNREVLNNLARVYEKMGNTEQSAYYFKRAQEVQR